MPYIDRAIQTIKVHEGFRSEVYNDHLGNPTIGFGFLIEDLKLTRSVAEQILYMKVSELVRKLESHIKFFHTLPEDAKVVLVDMSYQMGVNGLLRFERFLGYLGKGKYESAAEEILDSLYAQQTPNRAKMNAAVTRRLI